MPVEDVKKWFLKFSTWWCEYFMISIVITVNGFIRIVLVLFVISSINIDEIFPVKTRIPVFYVDRQIFSGIFFCWLKSEKIVFRCVQAYKKISIYIVYIFAKFGSYSFVWCWGSTRECQISNSRATRVANFLCILPNYGGGRLGSFPHEKFLMFYRNQNIICVSSTLLLKFSSNFKVLVPPFWFWIYQFL